MNNEINALRNGFNPFQLVPQFYNPSLHPSNAGRVEQSIPWNGFPRQCQTNPPRAEIRDNQDEYLEWFVHKNSQGTVTQIDFTCEGPEYWEFLHQVAPGKVLELYHTYVSTAVQARDLVFPNGTYNRRNKWNKDKGCIHLIQRANTLGAEINLAARATVIRARPDGTIITEAQELVRASQYGSEGRNSDPRIGKDVNDLARQGYYVTLRPPVGLYIHSINTTGWMVKDNVLSPAEINEIVTVERGDITQHMGLRLKIAVPLTKNYVLGDVTIGGLPIKNGGIVAKKITMNLVGMVIPGPGAQKSFLPVPPDFRLAPQPSAHTITAHANFALAPHAEEPLVAGFAAASLVSPNSSYSSGQPSVDSYSRSHDTNNVFYHTPANVRDFTNSDNYPLWSKQMSDFFEYSLSDPDEGYLSIYKNKDPSSTLTEATAQWYSKEKFDHGAGKPVPILWNAFPRRLKDQPLSAAEYPQKLKDSVFARVADEKTYFRDEYIRVQDEYCEWFSTLNSDKKITKVVFTCEGPEYWTSLFTLEPETCLKLYQQYVSDKVQLQDLTLPDGTYFLQNKWNTTLGCMHLVCPPNSLSAEVVLGAQACVLRRNESGDVTDADKLIKCSRYGVASRNSDPTIGSGVNTACRDGNYVTLADPVGLYFHSLEQLSGWRIPGAEDDLTPEEALKTFMKVERGDLSKHQGLRLTFPKGASYVLGDVTIGGLPLNYGGRIANFINMNLVGLVSPGATKRVHNNVNIY